jgi:DNA-binding transcriptional MerR regulator
MSEKLTISALAKRAGVSSKTLRYWESLGILPRAARSHTGYRLFDSESLRYITFIQKSKALGLSLAEMREVLLLARRGHCPCPEVIEWTEQRIQSLEKQVAALSALLARLKRARREWSRPARRNPACGNVCGLIVELPEAKFLQGGKSDAKTLAGTYRSNGGNGAYHAARSGVHCS